MNPRSNRDKIVCVVVVMWFGVSAWRGCNIPVTIVVLSRCYSCYSQRFVLSRCYSQHQCFVPGGWGGGGNNTVVLTARCRINDHNNNNNWKSEDNDNDAKSNKHKLRYTPVAYYSCVPVCVCV